jgi:hypothetical protein
MKIANDDWYYDAETRYPAARRGRATLTASDTTLKVLCEVVARHVTPQQADAILSDLLRVEGNGNYIETVERIVGWHVRTDS